MAWTLSGSAWTGASPGQPGQVANWLWLACGKLAGLGVLPVRAWPGPGLVGQRSFWEVVRAGLVRMAWMSGPTGAAPLPLRGSGDFWSSTGETIDYLLEAPRFPVS